MGCLVPGGCLLLGGGAAPGGYLLLGGPGLGGAGGDPPTATAAGGTHPTGMHSCFVLEYIDSLNVGTFIELNEFVTNLAQ